MGTLDSGTKEYQSQIFTGVDFSARQLADVKFDDCTFVECDFSETRFTRCRFSDCRFQKCNLSVIQVTTSRFEGVVFAESKLLGIDWTRANWSSPILGAVFQFSDCILDDSSFWGLKLKGLVAKRCRAHDVDFRDADLTQADFTGTDFERSVFGQTNLTSANFTRATNYTIDVLGNQVRKAKFSRFEAIALLEGLGVELVD